MDRVILHIDFDSFFASCEQHFNPNLRNKPIGVIAEHSRTCIIAASREAKKYGIKTGTRSWEAKKVLPNITFVPADFDKYYEISKKFISICTDYSPFVEVFSIDEVFIDITPTLHLYPSINHIVYDIKNKIKKEIGPVITVSIGISYNKLLAKLASGLNKPDGITFIKRGDLPIIYKKTELTDVCGIGQRYKKRLNSLGIYNFLDLQRIPISVLKNEFGNIASQELKRMAYFEDESMVTNYDCLSDVKSVGRNYCLPQNETNQTKILQTIYELCYQIALKLRKLEKKGKTVGLRLSGEKHNCAQKTINNFTNCDKEIFQVCKFLYKKWEWNYMARQISVWVSNLSDLENTNYSLFENPKKEKVTKTIDFINDKFGSGTIRNGFLLYTKKLDTKPNGYLADKFIRKDISKIDPEERLRKQP